MDQIYGTFLKEAADLLGHPLAKIKKNLVKIFPEECKISKLKLLFKKSTETDPKNCRHISFLPVV